MFPPDCLRGPRTARCSERYNIGKFGVGDNLIDLAADKIYPWHFFQNCP
jgi:hypothetical protein